MNQIACKEPSQTFFREKQKKSNKKKPIYIIDIHIIISIISL